MRQTLIKSTLNKMTQEQREALLRRLIDWCVERNMLVTDYDAYTVRYVSGVSIEDTIVQHRKDK